MELDGHQLLPHNTAASSLQMHQAEFTLKGKHASLFHVDKIP